MDRLLTLENQCEDVSNELVINELTADDLEEVYAKAYYEIKAVANTPTPAGLAEIWPQYCYGMTSLEEWLQTNYVPTVNGMMDRYKRWNEGEFENLKEEDHDNHHVDSASVEDEENGDQDEDEEDDVERRPQ